MLLLEGDCLELMTTMQEGSVDLVLTDPPYGSTKCKWDTIIPLQPMWEQLNRLAKLRSPMIFTATQPFTSILIMSNIKAFKYCWIWDKVTARGHLVAKKRPMAQHEDICVFYRKAPTYNPQMVKRDKPIRGKEYKRSSIMGGESKGYTKLYTHSYPKTIQTFSMDKKVGHPTQKPVALIEYLINTYTNPGDMVLDFAMGSGTTGVACKKLNRKFIGIELDMNYFELAKDRIATACIY